MREVHFCTTCDFRLPYCVRTDRRFCGQQCRLWWYRHRGTKRPDFPPGGDRDRLRRKKGQPKTFAEALAALADARAQVGRLEAGARQQQALENRLRGNLVDLARALTDTRSKSRGQLDALRDELEGEKKRAAESVERERAASEQVKVLREEVEAVAGRAQTAEKAAAETTADRHRGELAELRQNHAREAERVAGEIQSLTAQRDQLATLRDTLTRENAELTNSRDELRRRSESAERSLAQRDAELGKQLQNLAAAERAHKEVHAIADSTSRSLRAEMARRINAEQRVEQLTHELEQAAMRSEAATGGGQLSLLFGIRENALAAELKEVRRHRDDVIAEREQLAARILKLMAPGQYLEHAAAAGYDLTKDPLIRLKREEVLVEDRLAAWQEANGKRRRARRLDPEQTLDEQAYAAALSFRWKQIDHPHLRRKQQPKWVAVGFLLNAESERYLLTLTVERIAKMRRKMGKTA